MRNLMCLAFCSGAAAISPIAVAAPLRSAPSALDAGRIVKVEDHGIIRREVRHRRYDDRRRVVIVRHRDDDHHYDEHR